jgi:hypothetical protein
MYDKTQLKMLALSIIGMARILFGSSKKATFAIDVLTDLINERWDEAWDTYAKKRPLIGADAPDGDDPADALLAASEGKKKK